VLFRSPNHQREANPTDDILSHQKTAQGVNCNDLLGASATSRKGIATYYRRARNEKWSDKGNDAVQS
jgi:hypothetical protein